MDPKTLRFSKTHEWVHLNGDIATVGVSDFAVKELTDIVHLEFPEVGTSVSAGQPFGEIESVKSVNDLYSPVAGVIEAVNSDLEDNLALMSDDPYGAGWVVRIKVSDASAYESLLDHAAYEQMCQSGH
ncbi:MAG: glycine cleavage system protein GcvH [Planctomycetaceae bacterium]|nr:glycine cleavage system protein GcvH [Planctomycetaceae bacterium]MCB9953319.1 glycine cleavage system protein GcvH [Planctomycetaceae bacterium]